MFGKTRILVVASSLFVSGLVAAEPSNVRAAMPTADEGTPPPERVTARDLASSGVFLAGFEPARVAATPASALGVAGFDGARHTGVYSATADVALTGWLVLRGGIIYRPGLADDRSAGRPSVSLRGQLLHQQATGVDLSVSLGYSQERLSAEGGMLHVGTAVGRTFDRLSLIGNLALGTDPDEGDDRDGTLGGAVLYRAVSSLHVGAQGYYRRDLGSSDPRHLVRADGDSDFAVGPVATYARDVLVFTVQTGVSGIKGNATSALGLMAVGGVGAAF